MSTSTLTSLAMLKVGIDQGKDYLEYLRPFILQALFDHKPNPVTDELVTGYLRTDYGLEIPPRVVQILLRRLSKVGILSRSTGVYQIEGQLPSPGIAKEKAAADRHISAVVSGLRSFRSSEIAPSLSEEDVVKALCIFLSEFSIPCLRAYLRGTAIPNIS
jgi:hypothetical protein